MLTREDFGELVDSILCGCPTCLGAVFEHLEMTFPEYRDIIDEVRALGDESDDDDAIIVVL